MSSKKYVVQPVSLPPPTRLRSHNGSRSQPVLAKNSKSLHALSPSDLKKKERESSLAPLPYSPFTPYDHKDLDTKYGHERTIEEQIPQGLEMDLRCFRNYLRNEAKFAQHNSSLHPFQYIDGHTEDVEESKEDPDESNVDFKTWIRDMNTKLITKKRQIRTDKKNAELTMQQQEHTNSLPLSPSSSVSSPATSPNTSTTKKLHIFSLGKKKTPKSEEYDALERSAPRRVMTGHNLTTSGTQQPKESKFGSSESAKSGKLESTRIGWMHNHDRTTNKPTKSQPDSSPASIPHASDTRLFQVVRLPPSVDDGDEGPSSTQTSPQLAKSKSYSFRSRLSPATPSPTHHSKRLPRNVVSVGIGT